MITRAIPLEITHASDRGDLEFARMLFLEYAQSLDFSLCFQQFDEEIANLPGRYAPPRGRLLLAKVDGWPVGCVAIRPFSPQIGYLKRLYVPHHYRGLGIGKALASCGEV